MTAGQVRVPAAASAAGNAGVVGEAILDWVMRTRLIMVTNEHPTNLAESRAKRKTVRSGLHPLHEAAMRIADLGLGRSRSKTKDLVGILLAHGARAWRSGQPPVGIHIHVCASGKRFPVRMKLP